MSYIQDYFKYIIKEHDTFSDKPLIQIYVNKTQYRIIFKIKTGYYLQLLTIETAYLEVLKEE